MQNICQRSALTHGKGGFMAKIKRIALPRSPYTTYLVMLAAPAIVSWYFYGSLAFKAILTGVISAVVFEAIALKLMKKELRGLYDMHAVFTGLAIAMMLPATAPFWLITSGTAFAIAVAKIPFGTAKKSPFVPAAAGMAFLTVCFPDRVFRFPDIETAGFDKFSTQSLAAQLRSGGVQHMNSVGVVSMISGNITGALGTCCAIALLGSCALLIFIAPKRLYNLLGFLAACAVLAVLFPRGSFSRGASLLAELCAGSLLFSGVFFVTDPATSPKQPTTRLAYGAFAGVLCMIMRYFGAFEDGSCFGILLANALWPIADSTLRKLGYYRFMDKAAARRAEKKKARSARKGGEPA